MGPLFWREWMTVPRGGKNHLARMVYGGTLWVLAVTAWLSGSDWNRPTLLADLSHLGVLLFSIFSYLQLALFLFFSALATASAIALEKDRSTFLLLLITDLNNRELVAGKVFGSLLGILVLFLSGIPISLLLTVLGGVSYSQVFWVQAILLSTILAGGALGGLVALSRERTFQSLAMTALYLVSGLTVVRLSIVLDYLLPGHQQLFAGIRAALDPFQALGEILGSNGLSGAYACPLVMSLLALAFLSWGIAMVRRWNPSGEVIMQREPSHTAPVEEVDRASAHAAPGKVRRVVGNPILWRETNTRAYGRRPFLIKLAWFFVTALMAYGVFAPLILEPATSRVSFVAAYGLLPVSVLAMLLIATQAVTSITSERDLGALDLLLVTDIEPREFVFGKLGGVIYNVKEFLIPPLLMAMGYALLGLLAAPPAEERHLARSMNATSLLCLIIAGGVVVAFVLMLGIHVALRTANSRQAILHTLGTVFFLTVGTLITMALILINGKFEYQWASFLFFLAAGIGGLWWILNGERASGALSLASWMAPLAVFYTAASLVIARPGSGQSADPTMPALVIIIAFGFGVAAMLVPLLSEFDVTMGRTSGGAD